MKMASANAESTKRESTKDAMHTDDHFYPLSRTILNQLEKSKHQPRSSRNSRQEWKLSNETCQESWLLFPGTAAAMRYHAGISIPLQPASPR